MPWATVQPTEGGPLDLTEINTVLGPAAARGKAVRLRVTAGVEAPEWAEELDGPTLPHH